MKSIYLRPRREESLKRFHPWVFSGAIKTIQPDTQEGDLVKVFASNKVLMGIGHYQSGSIAVRMLSFNDQLIDLDFFISYITAAYNMRKRLGISTLHSAYRLIHGEGDGLPGLIIDIYSEVAVIQTHSVGMYKQVDLIAKALTSVINLKGIYNKSAATVPFAKELGAVDSYLLNNDTSETWVNEYDNQFKVNWEEGQKTGFFIDQRENRKLLQEYSLNARVLNMFCYSGGFSVSALRGGATYVHSVDSSAKAVQLTSTNVLHNFQGAAHEAFTQDAFQYMQQIEGKYDLIVLDPPAFAKHQSALNNALQAYKRLNARAIECLPSGGILFTFSCSQAVNKDQFQQAVFSAAAMVGRNVRILHRLSQPADHPVNIYHPEGEYLKGLVLYIS